MRLVILGSGTSFGVPVVGCNCRVCHSDDPRDRRTRVAAVIESDTGARILIDTPPELRLQLLAAGIDRVDAVFYTHDHADHVHGIDDLRALSARHGPLPIRGPREAMDTILRRFAYIFDHTTPLPPGTSRPELEALAIPAGVPVELAGVEVMPLALDHGGSPVFGYRIGPVGYVTDAKSVPEEAVSRLRGVEVLVLNALFERPHATHLSIPEALEVARRVGAGQTFLTHLTHRYAHADLEARLPPEVRPAYDGLVVTF